jgi:hypothetical protein
MWNNQHKSYLLIDNRAAGLGVEEYDLVSCKHCQRQIRITRGQHEGYFCMHCFGPVCSTPECNTVCVPWNKRVEESLARAAAVRTYGLKED